MTDLSQAANPFLFMMDPQEVLARVERSERLARLHRRVCHPLDKPALPSTQTNELSRHDRAIDELYERIESECAAPRT